MVEENAVAPEFFAFLIKITGSKLPKPPAKISFSVLLALFTLFKTIQHYMIEIFSLISHHYILKGFVKINSSQRNSLFDSWKATESDDINTQLARSHVYVNTA